MSWRRISCWYLGVRGYINTSTPEYVAFAERWRAQPATMDPVTGWCSSAADDAGSPIYQRYDVDDNLTSYDACVGMVFNTTEEIPPYAAYWYDAVYVVAYALQTLLEDQYTVDIVGAELRDAMLAQSFLGVSGYIAFDQAGDRAARSVQYTVVNHDGDTGLQHIGLWNEGSRYQECKATQSDCRSVVWSTGDGSQPKASFVNLGLGQALNQNSTSQNKYLAAILMALSEIDRNATLHPQTRLDIALQDTKCAASSGSEAAKSLQHWGADVIIGMTCSSATINAADVLSPYHIPQISGQSSSELLSSTQDSSQDPYPYLMRTIPSDAFQASALADLVHFYNWTRVATVAGEDSYGLSGIEAFQEAAEALDITIRQQDRLTYEIGVEDFSEVVRGLQESRALIIVTFGHALDTGRLMEQAYAAGVGGEGYVWVGSDAGVELDPAISDELAKNIMRGYLGVRGYINTSTPEYVAFAERWRAQPATMDPVTGWCSSAADDAGSPIYQRYDVDDNLTSYDACVGTVLNTTEEIPPYAAYWGSGRSVQYTVVNHDGDTGFRRLSGVDTGVPVDGTCIRGQTFVLSDLQCQPCTPGYFHDISNDICEPCEAGSVTANHGSSDCLLCLDLRDAYQDQAGQTECHLCPDGAECPSGVSAVGTEGYWRDSIHRDKLLSCLSDGACLGENDPYEGPGCREGHTGPICGVCADGYAKDVFTQDVCSDCSDHEENTNKVVVLFVCVNACLAGFLFATFYWPWIRYKRGQPTIFANGPEEMGPGAGAGPHESPRNGERGQTRLDHQPATIAADVAIMAEASGRQSMLPYIARRTLDSFFLSSQALLREGKLANLVRSSDTLSDSLSGVRNMVAQIDQIYKSGPGELCTLFSQLLAAIISFTQVIGSFAQMNVSWPGNIELFYKGIDLSTYFPLEIKGLHCMGVRGLHARYYQTMLFAAVILSFFLLLYFASGVFLTAKKDRE
ncbi:hypothetical protein CYMTET_50981, partial [Cymbomonas tetramitiformis]